MSTAKSTQTAKSSTAGISNYTLLYETAIHFTLFTDGTVCFYKHADYVFKRAVFCYSFNIFITSWNSTFLLQIIHICFIICLSTWPFLWLVLCNNASDLIYCILWLIWLIILFLVWVCEWLSRTINMNGTEVWKHQVFGIKAFVVIEHFILYSTVYRLYNSKD